MIAPCFLVIRGKYFLTTLDLVFLICTLTSNTTQCLHDPSHFRQSHWIHFSHQVSRSSRLIVCMLLDEGDKGTAEWMRKGESVASMQSFPCSSITEAKNREVSWVVGRLACGRNSSNRVKLRELGQSSPEEHPVSVPLRCKKSRHLSIHPFLCLSICPQNQ